MSFVVDSAEWQFDGWSPNDIITTIDSVLEFIAVSRERREKVWIGDDLQTRPMWSGADLWTIAARGGILGLPAEVSQELAAWLGSAPRYLDKDPWPEGMEDINISTAAAPPVPNPDVAWAHHWTRARRPVGCLGLKRSGATETRSSSGTAIVHWIANEVGRLVFWRSAIVLTGDNDDSLHQFAPHAYPDILFHEHALEGVARLAGGYLSLRSTIQSCFASLNDHGHWAFTFPPPALRPEDTAGPDPDARPNNKVIEDRFKGLGLDMAPEKPNVYADETCRKAREVAVGGVFLYCEWHVKLEPHRNRIHVHAPVQATGEKLLVGIIHEHLPLP